MSQLVPFSVYDDGRLYSYTVKFISPVRFLILQPIASHRSVTHDSLRYINILTYLLTYLLHDE